MKITKLLALLLVIISCFSFLSSCDGDTDGDKDEKPGEARQLYLDAAEYMNSHAYKQTVVDRVSVTGVEDSVTTTVSYMDGDNYYTYDEATGVATTYYDNVVYIETRDSKRKMQFDIHEMAGELGIGENFDFNMVDTVSDSNIELQKNSDGTSTVKFTIELPTIGPADYEFLIDANGHITSYVINMSYTVMDYTVTTVSEISLEYGDQYKVSPPQDADDYVTVDNITDLFYDKTIG